MYHVIGSLLLTRSFNIRNTAVQDEESVGTGHATMPDNDQDLTLDSELVEVGENDDEEEGEVLILPLADMLNARYGQDNVCFPLVFGIGCLMFDLKGETVLRARLLQAGVHKTNKSGRTNCKLIDVLFLLSRLT